jgi:hypothetical protein
VTQFPDALSDRCALRTRFTLCHKGTLAGRYRH